MTDGRIEMQMQRGNAQNKTKEDNFNLDKIWKQYESFSLIKKEGIHEKKNNYTFLAQSICIF